MTPMPLVETPNESSSQLPEITNTEMPASAISADPRHDEPRRSPSSAAGDGDR